MRKLVRCQNCGHANRRGAHSCGECGVLLPKKTIESQFGRFKLGKLPLTLVIPSLLICAFGVAWLFDFFTTIFLTINYPWEADYLNLGLGLGALVLYLAGGISGLFVSLAILLDQSGWKAPVGYFVFSLILGLINGYPMFPLPLLLGTPFWVFLNTVPVAFQTLVRFVSCEIAAIGLFLLTRSSAKVSLNWKR